MVYCDKCKHEFKIEVRTRYIKDDTEEMFFNCPNCHERYTSYYTNDKIKLLQSKLKYESRSKGKARVINKLSKDIENEMNRLQELIGIQ